MKKLIALGLTGAMLLSFGASAMAAAYTVGAPDEDGKGGYEIGTGSKGNSNTQFWLTIANEESKEDPSIEVTTVVTATDGFVYSVDYTDKSKNTFSVTAPLYVAMYAYGQSGTVVTPSDEYKITNASKNEAHTEITAVNKYRQVFEDILGANGIKNLDGTPGISISAGDEVITSDADLLKETREFSLAYTGGSQSGTDIQNLLKTCDYFYWDSTKGIVGVKAAYAVQVDKNEGRFALVERGETAEKAGEFTTTKYTYTASGKIGEKTVDGSAVTNTTAPSYTIDENTTYTVGKGVSDNKISAIKVKVESIKATTSNDWSLVSGIPTKSKELSMSINGTDLSLADGVDYATAGSNWILTEAKEVKDGDVVKDVEGVGTSLKISAAIAANQNAANDGAQVVSVAYTIGEYEGAESNTNG